MTAALMSSGRIALSTTCPSCGADCTPRNPYPTVDVVLYRADKGVLLIERRNPPYGWALPGGFIDYGECAEDAAMREAREETNLDVRLTRLLGVYSDPSRDPRFHTLSVVYVVEADESVEPRAGDDARNARFFSLHQLPDAIAFDHRKILADFIETLRENAHDHTPA